MNDKPNPNSYNSRREKEGGFYHVTSPSKKIAVFEYRIKKACEAINGLVEDQYGLGVTTGDENLDPYEKLTGITIRDLREIQKILDNYYS